MIAAFQVLQTADGIWVALPTTAAGMSVAIPAGVALSWFESIADRLQSDLEDLATCLFMRALSAESRHLMLHEAAG